LVSFYNITKGHIQADGNPQSLISFTQFGTDMYSVVNIRTNGTLYYNTGTGKEIKHLNIWPASLAKNN